MNLTYTNGMLNPQDVNKLRSVGRQEEELENMDRAVRRKKLMAEGGDEIDVFIKNKAQEEKTKDYYRRQQDLRSWKGGVGPTRLDIYERYGGNVPEGAEASPDELFWLKNQLEERQAQREKNYQTQKAIRDRNLTIFGRNP